ncbi:RDD family protein [Photobacterium sp. GB-27]|uniref:RDD family protein n=1 Tax=Photobacterium sp. GB-27 TaxID=2022109 RepID=UPI000D16F35A|nr:RDD family protein [Photobacterium sp. GB-27]PSV34679.1 RDD family protein [Photobacterium sp. GB-27]
MTDCITNNVIYVGFWQRVVATIVDTLVVSLVTAPLLYSLYGDFFSTGSSATFDPASLLVNYGLPFIGVMLFWLYKSATPGKMAIKSIIVDATTGDKPTVKQFIIRYLSAIPLGIGLLAVGWDKRKQGWYDKLANTVVIKKSK